MDELKAIGVEDVMKITGLSKKRAYALLRQKDCPTLPRAKNETFLVRYGAFLKWYTTKY